MAKGVRATRLKLALREVQGVTIATKPRFPSPHELLLPRRASSHVSTPKRIFFSERERPILFKISPHK